MTPTTFRALREHLGLSVAYAAGSLGVNRRTVSRWEAGETRLPPAAADWLQAYVDRTEAHIAFTIAQFADANEFANAKKQPAGNSGTRSANQLCLHASERQYRAAHRGGFLDHLWWNRSATRVAAITGAELAYEACQKPAPTRRALAPACDAEVE